MKPDVDHENTFKPSHPPRKGYNNTIEKFPEYMPNGVDKAKVTKMHARVTKPYQHEKTWKPTQ